MHKGFRKMIGRRIGRGRAMEDDQVILAIAPSSFNRATKQLIFHHSFSYDSPLFQDSAILANRASR